MADAEFTREFGFGETEAQLVQYLDDVAKFRESYFEKMASLGLSEESGWAYFLLEEADWTEDVPTDVCLLHFTTISNGGKSVQLPLPQLRLFSSEVYAVDDHDEYLTTDVTVNFRDDTVYMVGPSFYDSSDEEASSEDGQKKIRQSVPYFGVHEGRLVILPQERVFMTDRYIIPSPVRLEKGITPDNSLIIPFGGYDLLADKVHALSVARRILGMVADYQPRAQFSGSE